MAANGVTLGKGWLPLAFEVHSVHQHHDRRWTDATFTNDVIDLAFGEINWEKNVNFLM